MEEGERGAGDGMGLEDCGSAAGAGGGGEGEGERFRVLVVDDSPVDRRIVERLLLRSGSLYEGEERVSSPRNVNHSLERLFIADLWRPFRLLFSTLAISGLFHRLKSLLRFPVIAVDGGRKAIEILGLNCAVDDSQAVNVSQRRDSRINSERNRVFLLIKM